MTGAAAAQCGLFTHKSVPVIFEPPCILSYDGRDITTVRLLPEICKEDLDIDERIIFGYIL
jgi:hypothetical protein